MVKSDAADARVAREAAKGQVISIVTRRAIEQMEQSGAADEMAQQLTESLVKHAAALLP